MLRIDRRKGQYVVLFHRGEQCLIHVTHVSPSRVELSFEGDAFSFGRMEKGVLSKIEAEFGVIREDITPLIWTPGGRGSGSK